MRRKEKNRERRKGGKEEKNALGHGGLDKSEGPLEKGAQLLL